MNQSAQFVHKLTICYRRLNNVHYVKSKTVIFVFPQPQQSAKTVYPATSATTALNSVHNTVQYVSSECVMSVSLCIIYSMDYVNQHPFSVIFNPGMVYLGYVHSVCEIMPQYRPMEMGDVNPRSQYMTIIDRFIWQLFIIMVVFILEVG